MNEIKQCGEPDAGWHRVRCDERMPEAAVIRPKSLLRSRREFIGTAAAFAATSGCMTQKEPEVVTKAEPVAKWQPFPGTKRVRVVQWGMCHEHAEGKFQSLKRLPDDFELVGIVDDRASKTLREARNFKCYDAVPRLTPEQVWADKSIQCVFVEVSNDDLPDIAWECAKHGLAMHMDKPTGQSYPRYAALADYCRARGIPLQMGYMFRVNPAIRFATKAVREKWIGEINFIEADMNHSYGSAQYEPYIGSFSGGLLYNLGCHLVDFILPMMGDKAPLRAHPVQLTAPGSRPGVKTNGASILEWENGMALVRTCSKAPCGSRRLRIDGTRGSIEVCPIERFDGKPTTLSLRLNQDVPGYKKGTHTVDCGVQKDRYADQLKELAEIVCGERPNPDYYQHDIEVSKTTLMACGMKLD